MNGNQENAAWEEIVWCHALGSLPMTTNQLPWWKIEESFNLKCLEMTECGFPSETFEYLCTFCSSNIFPKKTLSFNFFHADRRVFGPATVYNPGHLISRSQISRDYLNDQYTLWDWIFGIMKLIKNHLKDLFRDGHITFISKIEAEESLNGHPVGSFRFRCFLFDVYC